MVSTTATAMRPPVPPVHPLMTRATPVKMRAAARNTGTLTDTAPAACSSPTVPAPISSTLRTMPPSDRPLGGRSSSAGRPHDAPGGAGGGVSGGGGGVAAGSVGGSVGVSTAAGGGVDHG